MSVALIDPKVERCDVGGDQFAPRVFPRRFNHPNLTKTPMTNMLVQVETLLKAGFKKSGACLLTHIVFEMFLRD